MRTLVLATVLMAVMGASANAWAAGDGALGDPCKADEECGGQGGVNYLCRCGECVDSRCADFSCDGDGGPCPFGSITACDGDEQCHGGEVCQDGQCVSAVAENPGDGGGGCSVTTQESSPAPLAALLVGAALLLARRRLR